MADREYKSDGLPWFKFKTGEFLADTSHLTYDERSAYLMIFVHLHHSGPIPVETVDYLLSRRVGCPVDLGKQMLEEFCFINPDDNCWHQDGVDWEFREVRKKSEKNRQSAITGARGRERSEGRFVSVSSGIDTQRTLDEVPANAGLATSERELVKSKEGKGKTEEDRAKTEEEIHETEEQETKTEKLKTIDIYTKIAEDRFTKEQKEKAERLTNQKSFVAMDTFDIKEVVMRNGLLSEKNLVEDEFEEGFEQEETPCEY